jgi:elongation of very long chain fatty acids protein 6
MAGLRELALGQADMSGEGLVRFYSEVQRLLLECSHTDRSNSPERQAIKQELIDLMGEFAWIPTVCCVAYVAFVHLGPYLISKPWPVQPVLSVWNLALAVFSAAGSYHCLGALLTNMHAHGWRYTVCTVPKKIDLMGTDLDVWAFYFVLSKVAEFFDTILKILLKKKFIFLHWYHHLATAWLCWVSIAHDFAPGMWIAALNYTVHAPMYTYYFLSSVLNKYWFYRICRPIAPLITTIQISQMAVFTVVNVSAVYYLFFDEVKYAEACSVKLMNLHINAMVVISYLVLFVALFLAKYIRPRPKKPQQQSVRHVVLLKLADEATAAQKETIINGLRSLPAIIPEIRSYKVGEQIAAIDDGRNTTLGVVADFANEADYKVYAAHPAHQAVIAGAIKPALAPGGRSALQFVCDSVDSSDTSAVEPTAGVRHVVLLKLQDTKQKQVILNGLRSLPAIIPEIRSYKVGEQITAIDDGRNTTLGVVADFANEADYKVYAAHPAHQAVIAGAIKPALAPGGRSALQFACATLDNPGAQSSTPASSNGQPALRRSSRIRSRSKKAD